MNQSFVVAIASHKRGKQLQEKTLSLLDKHRIDFDYVFVFCSSESYDEYEEISKEWGFNLVLSKNSIMDTRNHIIDFFEEGTRVIEMDDDVEDILHIKKGMKSKPVKKLKGLFEECFDMLDDNGLWGFNANTNSFFSDGADKWGLYSIINSCLGYINDKRIKMTVSEKEDFERCIQMYKLGLNILKRSGYGIKTKYWTNKGGIQDRYGKEKRIEVQRQSAENIMKKYPWCCYKKVRANGIVDIRFRSKDPLKLYK